MEKPVAGHRLGAEAAHQPIIAATAADGAEHHVLALFVLHLEGEFDLEDRAGVVFEATDDGGVDADAVGAVAAALKSACIGVQFSDASIVSTGTSPPT